MVATRNYAAELQLPDFGEAKKLDKVDVVIVGLGAAGGIASYVLTQAGLKVVGLEAGPRLTNADFLAEYDELKSLGFQNVLGAPKSNKEVPTWRRSEDEEAAPPPYATRMVNAVGGSSIHYGGYSARFQADDFRVRSSTVEKYGEDAIPEGVALEDWPVTYDNLEHFYEQVEYLIGVSGEAGANPFESPRKSDYPMPPLQATGFGELAAEALSNLGYDPYYMPSAINSEPYDGRPTCSYCGYCGGYGCWNDSKNSTLVSAIPKAEETGNLEVRPNSRVVRILTDESKRASGVHYLDESGALIEQPASLVIVSGFTYENTRLLLLSANEDFPTGLANSNGQVGKHFMAQSYPSVNGKFEGVELKLFGGASTQGIAADNFNSDNFDHTGLGFIRGTSFTIQPNESNIIAASRKVPPSVPQWGSEYKAWLATKGSSTGPFSYGQIEVLPYETNYLDLDPTTTDELGLPVVRVTFDLGENEQKIWDYVRPRWEEVLKEMGATETWASSLNPHPVNAHAYGGTRAGTDPETSVLDENLLTHEIPNLAVMGSSAFPSTTGYAPTLTIQAWAWKAAAHIAEHFDEITS